MTHKQILDKIGQDPLSEAVTYDLNILLNRGMSLKKGGSITNVASYVLPLMLKRWNCVLQTKDELGGYYKEKVALVLATLFHKCGLVHKPIIEDAIEAIDVLNNNVILCDSFYRRSPEIKDFLKTLPKELSRRPKYPKHTTFFREKDIVSIQLAHTYYVAYVHEIMGVNESPILEFYDVIFKNKPEAIMLKGAKAKGRKFNDGTLGKAWYAVFGMKYQPDFANQIHLLSSNTDLQMTPKNDHLIESTGRVAISNIFSIQDTIKELFVDNGPNH